MRDASPAGVLLGSAVLFVILWELRSAIGLLAGVDLSAPAYFLATVAIVAITAFGLSVGLFQLSATVLDKRI